ncbi:MAG: response regulator [Chloroflexi bacterium]|nr:response regulator [Chloroflexota bacterium]
MSSTPPPTAPGETPDALPTEIIPPAVEAPLAAEQPAAVDTPPAAPESAGAAAVAPVVPAESLPAAPVPALSPPAAPTPAAPTPAAPAQPTFLYVEDDQLSREIMRMLITRVMGYSNLTMFDENSNFLERLHALPSVPDVIFLDIQMQPYSGYEMLNMLRSDPTFQQSKIIAMTASVMATDVQAFKTAGFDGLIGKPIMRLVFPELLRQVLAGESVWFVS